MEKSGIKLKNWQMMSHMAFSTKHQGVYMGEIECEGLPLHGKILTKHYTQRIRKGEAVGTAQTIYFVNDPECPMFKTVDELVAHYHGTNENQN